MERIPSIDGILPSLFRMAPKPNDDDDQESKIWYEDGKRKTIDERKGRKGCKNP